ncbi:MAG: hypothetical protein J6J38_10985 [Lachnospiraceae bacterium]|nr:hypothetical protein [Lachnospiraceae bacterium]
MHFLKKHKKGLLIISIFLLVFICIFVFANRKPKRPVTDLEFWIGENVDEVDFSGYVEKFGLFGGREFYGSGYVPTLDGDRQIDPEHCVIYTVTSFPDYSSNKRHVTRITITDPDVTFYGISLNSTHKEFERLITEQGFRITDTAANHHTAKRGKYTVIFTKDSIRINVKVRNLFGIQF